MILLRAADVEAALPMSEAVAAMAAAFAALHRGEANVPPRTAIDSPRGRTLLMGAHVAGLGLATKVVSVFPDNSERGLATVQGLVVVLDDETGAPAALIDGAALTAWRTGAGCGAATDLLARADASVGCVIGCGVQGRTQALALAAVRPLTRILLVDARPAAAADLAAELTKELGLPAVAMDSAQDAVAQADVVCAATTSATPVFEGSALKDGAHVNAVGAFTPQMRELDDTTIARARVFVDAIEGAAAESGELLHAEREGVTARDEWTELGAVAAGDHPGRDAGDELTLFKSVGHAVQDVAAAAGVLAGARRLGLGTELVP